jgi:hypothetical protein
VTVPSITMMGDFLRDVFDSRALALPRWHLIPAVMASMSRSMLRGVLATPGVYSTVRQGPLSLSWASRTPSSSVGRGRRHRSSAWLR